MNIQQLEAVCAIVRSRFNMSHAAEALGRSQSGLSRQVKELELDLGAQIFVRSRNKVLGLTPQGEQILRVGQRIQQELKTLEQIAGEGASESSGEIRVATTHVYARYLLPGTIKAFIARFPGLSLTLQQCDPGQCRQAIASGDADVGIITLPQKPADTIVTIPAYRVPRCVVVPAGHPLLREQPLRLKKLAEYPLIAYPAAFNGRATVEAAFARAGVKPRIVCSATDADVCKAYVQVGMGVTVLATLAFDPVADHGLVAIDAGHLFQQSVVSVVFRRHSLMTRSVESFIAAFAPHFSSDLVQRAIRGGELDRARLIQRLPVAGARLEPAHRAA